MPDQKPTFAGDMHNLPMGDIIRSVAMSIADAQWALDRNAMVVAEMMSGRRLLRDLDSGELLDADGEPATTPTVVDSRVFFGYTRDPEGNVQPRRMSMVELGFAPVFYQFVDTVIEMKLAMRVSRNAANQAVALATTVDGSYSNSYSFVGELASTVRTKLVPVPPPAALDERVRALLAEDEEAAAAARRKARAAEAPAAQPAGTEAPAAAAQPLDVAEPPATE